MKIIKYILIALVLYYIFSGIDFKVALKILESYSIIFLFIVMLSVVLSDFALSLRWKFLTKNECSLIASFEAAIMSGFFNFILPAKLGELSKVIYLKKIYGFNINNSLSLLILERLYDVLILAILTLFASTIFSNNPDIQDYAFLVFFIIILALILLKTNYTSLIIQYIPIRYIRVYFKKMRKNIIKHLYMKNIILIFMYTIIVWLSYFLTIFIFLIYVAEFDLSFIQTLIVFVISSIAMAIPLMPGGAGTYQASIIFALGLYGIPKEDALIASIALHIMLLIPSFLMAIFILSNKNLSLDSFKKVKI